MNIESVEDGACAGTVDSCAQIVEAFAEGADADVADLLCEVAKAIRDRAFSD